MGNLLHLKVIFLIYILTITEWKNGLNVDANSTPNGVEFLEKVVRRNLDVLTEKTLEYLLFTAPMKLCPGGCSDDDVNVALGFPLFVNSEGKKIYKKMFQRDHILLHKKNKIGPFKKRTTMTYTLCEKYSDGKNKTSKENTEKSKKSEKSTHVIKLSPKKPKASLRLTKPDYYDSYTYKTKSAGIYRKTKNFDHIYRSNNNDNRLFYSY